MVSNVNCDIEETVATLLPQVTPNGPVLSKGVDSTFIDTLDEEIKKKEKEDKDMEHNEELLTESFEDKIINAQVSSDVDRKIRKDIIEIYNLQVEIADAEANKKDSKKVIDLKREYVHKKTMFSHTKSDASGVLRKSINELERIAKKYAKEEITKIKEEKDKEERVQEGVAYSDISGYYITEMNHVKGILSDVLNSGKVHTVSNIKDTMVPKNVIAKEYPEAIKKSNDYINQMKEVGKLADSVFARFKNLKLNNDILFTDMVERVHNQSIQPSYHKFGDKFVFMGAELLFSYDCPYGEKNDKLSVFTIVLHNMRKMTQQIQKLNKNEMVVVKCETYDYKKDKIKGVVITATVKSVIGKAHDEKPQKEEPKPVAEAAEEKKEVSPELKRLDEKRGRLADLQRKLNEAEADYKKTGENIYSNKIKGLTAQIEKLDNEIKDGEKKLKKEEKEITESALFTESKDMEPEIRPIVEKLNAKGYKVKYASPGHTKLRKQEDHEPDGVYYGKLYSDARVMFEDKYKFPDAPKYWHWRDVDDCSYLDISPIPYDSKSGDTPDEAFEKWKRNYMDSLKSFVDSLPNNGKEVTESVDDVSDEDMVEAIFEKMGLYDDLELSDEVVTESTILNSDNNLLKELDSLLA